MPNKFWKNYQEEAFRFCVIRCRDLSYLILGLNGESNELTEEGASVESELGGVLWYTSQITKYLGMDLDDIMEEAQSHHVCVPNPLCLNSYAGRLAEIYKKAFRGDREIEETVCQVREILIKYIQILLFVASTAHVTLEDMAIKNIEELTYREKHGCIKGDGDHRGKEADQQPVGLDAKYKDAIKKPMVIR